MARSAATVRRRRVVPDKPLHLRQAAGVAPTPATPTGLAFGHLTRKRAALPLHAISVTTPGVSAIAEFAGPRDHQEERRYILACREGFELNGFIYRASLPATVNNTYALRSINNKRADILVALRIVRADENGSLTMAWRKLKTNPKPSWKRKT